MQITTLTAAAGLLSRGTADLEAEDNLPDQKVIPRAPVLEQDTACRPPGLGQVDIPD